MLAVLKIKNLALVDDISWELGDGLICVTGQTGAGKSMIVGALKLVLGERANRDLIRNGATSCSVEAVFHLATSLSQVNEMLAECGLEACDGDTLIVKRSFGSANRQFINCSPCTASVLKKIGRLLIDLHGPHEHQSLLSQDRQLAMLDAYAQSAPELKAYSKAFRSWEKSVQDLEDFKALGKASDQEIELLRYQLEEISNASLIEEEMAELDRRYTQARNATRLITAATGSLGALQSAIAGLAESRKHLHDLENLDPDCSQFLEGFESSRLEIEELEKNLSVYTTDLEVDPVEMAEMETRIDQIEHLKRKYGQTISEVLAYEKEAKTRLDKVEHREEEVARLEELVGHARAWVDETGTKLTIERKNARESLEKEIIDHLEGLGLAQSVFELKLEPFDTPRSSGLETVDFLFGPNPGEPVKPLRVIASSGEISRVMLAVKSALADQDETPLMVFDEIDANVGGEIAGSVGAKMANLANRHQVISITHMPQVAARANEHFLVTKIVEANSTVSKIERLESAERVDELARMLGGVGEESVALAKKMLEP